MKPSAPENGRLAMFKRAGRPPLATSTKSGLLRVLLVGIVLGVALLLRIVGLGDELIGSDEPTHALDALRLLRTSIFATFLPENTVFHLLTGWHGVGIQLIPAAIYLLIGSIGIPLTDFWLTFPAVVIGMATIGMSFELVREIHGFYSALIVSTLLTVSPIHVGMSRSFNGNSLLAYALLLTAMVLAIRILKGSVYLKPVLALILLLYVSSDNAFPLGLALLLGFVYVHCEKSTSLLQAIRKVVSPWMVLPLAYIVMQIGLSVLLQRVGYGAWLTRGTGKVVSGFGLRLNSFLYALLISGVWILLLAALAQLIAHVISSTDAIAKWTLFYSVWALVLISLLLTVNELDRLGYMVWLAFPLAFLSGLGLSQQLRRTGDQAENHPVKILALFVSIRYGWYRNMFKRLARVGVGLLSIAQTFVVIFAARGLGINPIWGTVHETQGLKALGYLVREDLGIHMSEACLTPRLRQYLLYAEQIPLSIEVSKASLPPCNTTELCRVTRCATEAIYVPLEGLSLYLGVPYFSRECPDIVTVIALPGEGAARGDPTMCGNRVSWLDDDHLFATIVSRRGGHEERVLFRVYTRSPARGWKNRTIVAEQYMREFDLEYASAERLGSIELGSYQVR